MAETEGVRNFHLNSDVDSSKFAQHHTIGTKYGQAAPGEGYASLVKRVEELEERPNWYNSYLWAAYTSTDGTIPNGSWTDIAGYSTAFPGFGATEVKQQSPQPVSYGLGTITADMDCWVTVSFYIEFVNNTTGRRGIRLSMDNADSNVPANVAEFQPALTASPYRLTTTYNGPLANTHFLKAQAYQDSGAALTIQYRQLIIEAKAL